ncbi:MAG: response regulator transcription factor, partial [Desulfomonilia bacterium]|nr:response regulator transcription factor [Desulfomonilia bacterium]
LRRVNQPVDEHLISAGSFVLDQETRQATVGGRELKLTPSEFKLLKVFMVHPNRVFSRSDLVNLVQGYEFEGYDRTIDTHIKNLRKKIASLMPHTEIITSVYGEGYKFTAR